MKKTLINIRKIVVNYIVLKTIIFILLVIYFDIILLFNLIHFFCVIIETIELDEKINYQQIKEYKQKMMLYLMSLIITYLSFLLTKYINVLILHNIIIIYLSANTHYHVNICHTLIQIYTLNKYGIKTVQKYLLNFISNQHDYIHRIQDYLTLKKQVNK